MDRTVIESHLVRLSSVDLDEAVEKLAELEEISVDAEGDYRVTFAKTFTTAAGSIEDRKQQAILAADDAYRVWGKAKAAVIRQKEHLKALHARVDVGRTLSSNTRAEAAFARSGMTP